MIFNPILPIWLMSILAAAMLLFKRKGAFAYVRQIVIVILLFAINLRPMLPGPSVVIEEQKRTDTKVVFVIDNTISMQANDGNNRETRMDAVKADCAHIVTELEGAEFSIITFHHKAGLLSPFTDNSEHIINTIDSLTPPDQLYARGSSLNTPLDTTLVSLKKTKEDSSCKVFLFFISDGEITDGSKLGAYNQLSPYIDGGAVLGYGTANGGNMYVHSYYDDSLEEVMDTSTYPYTPAISRIDEDNLKQLSKDMGIPYIHMTKQSEVDYVIDDIKNSQNTSVTTTTSIEESIEGGKDIYFYFAITLLLMLVLEAILTFKRKK